MNPIFDVGVIGVIVGMVFLNVYFSREQSEASTMNLSGLRKKLPVSNSVEHRTLVRPPATVHLSLD